MAMTFDIYFHNLNAEAQRDYLAFMDKDSANELKESRIFPIATAVKKDNKGGTDE